MSQSAQQAKAADLQEKFKAMLMEASGSSASEEEEEEEEKEKKEEEKKKKEEEKKKKEEEKKMENEKKEKEKKKEEEKEKKKEKERKKKEEKEKKKEEKRKEKKEKKEKEEKMKRLCKELDKLHFTEHPDSYVIASVNFNGRTDSGNAELRKRILKNLLKEKQPSIVFVQECPWIEATVIKKHLKLQKKFKYKGNTKQAGILWDSKVFDVTSKQESFEQEITEDRYPYLKHNFDRLWVCEVKVKVNPKSTEQHSASGTQEKKTHVSEFIAMSWHGPHRMELSQEQKVFQELLNFVKMITKDGQKACIIGGDFNLSLQDAKDTIAKFPRLSYAAPNDLKTIDYFIFTSDLINVLDAKQLYLDYKPEEKVRREEDKEELTNRKILDHPPVFAVLAPVNPPTEATAALNTNIPKRRPRQPPAEVTAAPTEATGAKTQTP